MDNGAFSQDPEKGTELKFVDKKKVNLILAKETQTGHVEGGGIGGGSCKTTQAGQTGAAGSEPKEGPSTSAGHSSGKRPFASTCKPEVCQAARARFTPPDLRGSPWHRNKTIFLVIIICSLIVWSIVYSILSKLDLL